MTNDKVTIELTKEQVRDLLLMYEFNLFAQIREDPEIDNIRWLRVQLDTYDSLARSIGEMDSGGESHEESV